MITKIYGVFGYREACLTVPVSGDGKSYLKISFVNGNPQHGAYYRPATYVCADEVEQDMIENSVLFTRGTIKLVKQFGDKVATSKPAKNVEVKPEEEKKQDVKEFPDVVTIEELRAVLKANGAKAPTLTSENAMKRFAEASGLAFPNYNFN